MKTNRKILIIIFTLSALLMSGCAPKPLIQNSADTPESMVRLHTLGASSVDFVVRPWVKVDDYWDVYWDVTRTVKLRFDEEGVSIPFPQHDVHVYNQNLLAGEAE